MNVLSSFNLENKIAIVTGAARGLGEAMATGLAEAGADIVIPDINYKEAKKAADKISELGVDTLALKCDVTEKSDVQEMVKKVIDEFDRIDILINNAGICKNIAAEEMSLKDWQEVIDINLTGVFLCSQAVAKEMIDNNGGSIINISSMSAEIVNYPQPQCSYNASKAGVSQLTKSLAAEWAKYDIRVNAIAPGYMKTELTAEILEKNPERKEYWIEPTPMKRMGKPEELKGVAVYLASEASSFMTGNIMNIDGGYTLY
ncbi:MAG: SDR family oxidoreductase [Halanaerobiales bacterium]|nr:SDR family oxidoreductase [Halanaerobiales bacterium]